MLTMKYKYITKSSTQNLLSGRCKVTHGKKLCKRLVVKIDDDLEKTLVFVHQILRNAKFDIVHCFVKTELVNKILDCEVLITILHCSNYRFNMTFAKKDNFVELYRIEKIKDGCYFG